MPHVIEPAASARAKCRGGSERIAAGDLRHCRPKIDKGAWRIPLVFWEDGRFSPAGFVRLPCTAAYFGTTDVVARLARFSPGLTGADLSEIQAELLKPSPAPGTTATE
jgi:hypothetical protein